MSRRGSHLKLPDVWMHKPRGFASSKLSVTSPITVRFRVSSEWTGRVLWKANMIQQCSSALLYNCRIGWLCTIAAWYVRLFSIHSYQSLRQFAELEVQQEILSKKSWTRNLFASVLLNNIKVKRPEDVLGGQKMRQMLSLVCGSIHPVPLASYMAFSTRVNVASVTIFTSKRVYSQISFRRRLIIYIIFSGTYV